MPNIYDSIKTLYFLGQCVPGLHFHMGVIYGNLKISRKVSSPYMLAHRIRTKNDQSDTERMLEMWGI